MGLDTTHDCWHGPYSAFTRWRQALAKAAGYAVWNVVLNGIPAPTVMIDWGHLGTEAHLMGEWEETPDDPLLVLIVHHDYTGDIRPAQAGPLADRIEELAQHLPPEEHDSWDPHWMRGRSAQFVAGLRTAAAAGEPVRFM